jgi:hypothetical protein
VLAVFTVADSSISPRALTNGGNSLCVMLVVLVALRAGPVWVLGLNCSTG